MRSSFATRLCNARVKLPGTPTGGSHARNDTRRRAPPTCDQDCTYTPVPKRSISIRRLHKACSPTGQPVHCPGAVQNRRRSSDKCANTKGGRGHRVSRKERAGLRRSMRAASPSTRAHRWASCVARAPRSQWARGGSRQVASGPVGQGAQEQSCPAHKQQQVWESWAGITPEPPRLCQCS